MTNHFTQEEAVTLAVTKCDDFRGGLLHMTPLQIHAFALAVVDAKLAKTGARTQGEDWYREQRHALNEGACAIRQLIREGCWAEQSEAIAATLDSIRTTHPQASDPAPSTAGEHSSAIEMAIAALKDLGSHGAYSASIAEPAIVALQSTTQPVGELTDEQIGKAWSVAEGEHNASASVKRRITRAILAAAHKIGGQG